ncbi:MAG: carboxypeptidase regulatory-like domain-containing protein [Vicinamibacterales bacterium]|nr:carboxypeptidase regulatory-like domain-containing protein [Vicinamibacterales bacterium]
MYLTRMFRSFGGALAILLSLNTLAFAQGTGELVGRVTDASGGVLPAVTVTATNVATKNTRSTVSTDTGDYTFTLLPIGSYTVKIELQGFQTVNAKVDLSTGDRARVDAKMTIGTVEESVMVTGEAPLLQTDTSTVSSLINEKTVQDAPIPGRNIIRMVQLIPGASEGALSSLANGTRPDERRQTSSVSINGVNDVLNNQLVDGMDNNERSIGTVAIKPSIDAIAEVRVQTNMYTAEVGRTLGGVINIITKSGGNQFHGSAFEFARHEMFDSRLFFARGDKPEIRQNQYGGSLGGPIKANRTFFFVDYEGYRLKQGVPFLITVPTAKMRTGDFSELPVTIYDPINAVRTPFPGNVIPTSRFDPIAAKYLALWPVPTSPGLANNFAYTSERIQNNQAVDFRVDHRFNNNNTVFVRYSYNQTYTLTPSLCPPVTIGTESIDPTCIVGGAATGNYAGPNDTTAQNLTGSFVRIFNSTTVAEIKGSFSKPDILSTGPNHGENLGNFFGVPNANAGTIETSGLPLMEIRPTTFAAAGETQWVPLQIYNRTYQVAGTVTQARGSHNLKVGAGIVLRHWGVLQSNSAQGLWGFDANPTNSGTGAGGGHGFASFLLGYPTDVRRLYTPGSPVYSTPEPSVFVQDDWRATSWLTVNLGVRYDVFGPLSEKDDHLSNWDPDAKKLLVATVDGVSRTSNVKSDLTDIAPKLGFSASLPHNMVLRGGFGLAYFPNNKNAGAYMKNPPFTANYGPVTSTANSNGVPNLFLKDGLPVVTFANPAQPTGNVIGTALDYKSDRAKQFNLMIEKEFSGNVFTAGYIGSRGDRLVAGKNFNLAPAGAGSVDPRRPLFSQYPSISAANVLTNLGASTYDAAQFVFTRRSRNGLTFTTHYTRSHARSMTLAPWDMSILEWGDTINFDVPHRFVATVNYELPWGKDLTGVAHGFLANWQVNFTAFAQSGVAYTVLNQSSRTNTGGTDRPNVTGDPNLDERTVQKWFKTEAFSAADPFTAGNIGSALMHGPAQRQTNFSLFKDLSLKGTQKIQLRAEVYNLFNQANFGLPDNNFGSTGFGSISSTGNSIPRQMQFGIKYLF